MHGLNGLLFIAWGGPLLPLVMKQMVRKASHVGPCIQKAIQGIHTFCKQIVYHLPFV